MGFFPRRGRHFKQYKITMAGVSGFTRGLALLNLKKQFSVRQFSTSVKALGGHGPPAHGGEVVYEPVKVKIGKREVVGFGSNGEEIYIDHVHYPFPAIRFKEDTGDIAKLREKEKGDWKKMTIEEKKVLYRASFCSTLAEMTAPTGEWKRVSGYVLIALGISLWMVIWTQKYAIPGGLRTLEPEYIKANIQKRIDMEMGPIEGVASQYDYEKNQWKK